MGGYKGGIIQAHIGSFKIFSVYFMEVVMMDEVMRLIGRRIKFIRVERGIQQTKLAELIGVSQTHLSNMESGRTGTTIHNLLKLQKIFECPISDFFIDFDGAVPVKEEDTEVSLEELVKLAKLLKKVNLKEL